MTEDICRFLGVFGALGRPAPGGRDASSRGVGPTTRHDDRRVYGQTETDVPMGNEHIAPCIDHLPTTAQGNTPHRPAATAQATAPQRPTAAAQSDTPNRLAAAAQDGALHRPTATVQSSTPQRLAVTAQSGGLHRPACERARMTDALPVPEAYGEMVVNTDQPARAEIADSALAHEVTEPYLVRATGMSAYRVAAVGPRISAATSPNMAAVSVPPAMADPEAYGRRRPVRDHMLKRDGITLVPVIGSASILIGRRCEFHHSGHLGQSSVLKEECTGRSNQFQPGDADQSRVPRSPGDWSRSWWRK